MKEIEFSELYEAMLRTIEKYFKFDKDQVREEIERNF